MTRASDTAKLLGAGATILDGATISTADNTEQLTLISTDADANQGPVLRLRRDSASPADNDIVGYLVYSSDNDAGEITDFGGIRCHIDDASDGTEDGNLKFFTNKAGTEVSRMGLASGETVFNEDSVDVDFRVESDGHAHALFLQASDGIVKMQTTNDDPAFNNQTGVSIGSNNGSALAGVGQFSCNGGVALRANRSNETGATIALHTGGAQKGVLGTQSSSDIYIGCDRGAGLRITDQELAPSNASGALRDDAVDLGHPGGRFDDVRATNGTIQTSDKNDKQDIEELTDAEKRVAVVAKGLMRKFRWKSAVTKKGDDARTHFGIIAQDLQDAFTAEKLDITKYAMFCSDTWWEKNGEVYKVESDAPSDATKKTRLGVRYSELLAFIISAI